MGSGGETSLGGSAELKQRTRRDTSTKRSALQIYIRRAAGGKYFLCVSPAGGKSLFSRRRFVDSWERAALHLLRRNWITSYTVQSLCCLRRIWIPSSSRERRNFRGQERIFFIILRDNHLGIPRMILRFEDTERARSKAGLGPLWGEAAARRRTRARAVRRGPVHLKVVPH